jgi:DNA uptake protein ComE-like DNA-binding protein
VTAGKIIANRPYMTLEELVTRNVIRPSLYEELKNDLTL